MNLEIIGGYIKYIINNNNCWVLLFYSNEFGDTLHHENIANYKNTYNTT